MVKWIYYNHYDNLCTNVKGEDEEEDTDITNVLLTYIKWICSFGFVATGGMDQKLIIWEPQRTSSRCICEHEEGITCVAWLGTTQYVASGCIDGKVRIWDSLTGNCERTFTGRSTVQSLALTADGTYIVSVSDDGIARVFGL